MNFTFDMKMKRPTQKVLWLAFVIGVLSPILALMVKPAHYPFYMFFPATPQTWFGRLQLFAGNSLLVVGFIVAFVAAVYLAVRGVRQGHYLALLCPLVVLANPIQQPIFLESIDTHMNYRWRDKAEQLQIIGKTPEQVRQLLGKAHESAPSTPRTIDRDGNVTWQGETYTTWEYQPLPVYWLGSRFQVFFKNGKASSFEANDD